MLREFWESAPKSYKIVVGLAMSFLAVGLLVNILGNINHNAPLALGALWLIGAGMLLHVLGLVIRGRAITRQHREAENARK